MIRFKDRPDGGRQLSTKLLQYRGDLFVTVFGLARDGVETAATVALELQLPLDVLVVHNICAPDKQDCTVGAVAQDGTIVWDQRQLKSFHVTPESCAQVVEQEKERIAQCVERYRGGKKLPSLSNKAVILVDDGITTGAAMCTAVEAMRNAGAAKVIVAVPVGALRALETVEACADEVVCLNIERQFPGVAHFYENFDPIDDHIVLELLRGVGKPSE